MAETDTAGAVGGGELIRGGEKIARKKGRLKMGNRRDFLKASSVLLFSTGIRCSQNKALSIPIKPTGYFGVHPFVERTRPLSR